MHRGKGRLRRERNREGLSSKRRGRDISGWRQQQEAWGSSSSTERAAAAAELKAAAAAAKPHLLFLSCYLTDSPVIDLISLSVPKSCLYLQQQQQQQQEQQQQEQQQQQQQEEGTAAALGIVIEDGRLQVLSLQGLFLLFEYTPTNKAVLHAASDKRAK